MLSAGPTRVACVKVVTSTHEVINAEQQKTVELALTNVGQENARIQRLLTQTHFQQSRAGTTEPLSRRTI